MTLATILVGSCLYINLLAHRNRAPSRAPIRIQAVPLCQQPPHVTTPPRYLQPHQIGTSQRETRDEKNTDQKGTAQRATRAGKNNKQQAYTMREGAEKHAEEQPHDEARPWQTALAKGPLTDTLQTSQHPTRDA